MNLTRIILILVVLCSLLFIYMPPDWDLEKDTLDNNETSYTLSYRPLRGKPLLYCLLDIDKPFAIRVMLPLEDSKLQNEIKSYYRKHLPQALKQALHSSGNMHNPALTPLIKNFPEAFKSTTLYKDLDKSLQRRGYKIQEKITFEKFSIFKNETPFVFHADIWMEASPAISHQSIQH